MAIVQEQFKTDYTTLKKRKKGLVYVAPFSFMDAFLAVVKLQELQQ